MTIWRVRVRVMWVTIWYLTMDYLPKYVSASNEKASGVGGTKKTIRKLKFG